MKHNVTHLQIPTQLSTIRIGFTAWDIVKMLTAAIFCGLAASIAAAGLVLLLSSNAEAREPSTVDAAEAAAAPGTLVIGPGCDGASLDALERDWVISVQENEIIVRVMQTWLMPKDFDGAAVFRMRLPADAKLNTLSASTPTRDWEARQIPAIAAAKLSPSAYLKLTREHLLVTAAPDGSVNTSPIMDLRGEEALVVHYAYRVSRPMNDAAGAIQLLLQPPQSESSDRVPEPGRASVWVDFGQRKPKQLITAPQDANIEREQNLIAGLSWSSPALSTGEKFQLAWRM
jgi:hypothetical protein